MRRSPERRAISQAVRELRKGLGISQQELAFRTKMAIRTIARWEADQPPRGTALIKLLELARENDLAEVASVFRQVLEDDAVVGGIATDPDVKPWLEAVHDIYRWRERQPLYWYRLTRTILDGIDSIKEVPQPSIATDRLVELLDKLTVSAMLPAERDLKHRAEALAAQEGLAYDSAYEALKERDPRLWDEFLQQDKHREEMKAYERLKYGPAGTEKGSKP